VTSTATGSRIIRRATSLHRMAISSNVMSGETAMDTTVSPKTNLT
jgi:hypothetical protein